MHQRTLPLEAYQDAIQLLDPFVLAGPPLSTLEEAEELTRWLLDQLEPRTQQRSGSSTQPLPRQRLYQHLIARPPGPFPAGCLEALDRLLQWDRLQRPVWDAAQLPRLSSQPELAAYPLAAHCSLWRGDITTLQADAIVNAANSALLGCFVPNHACIDNAIHAVAGPRLREDCAAIRRLQGGEEPTGQAKLTRGYHLPARFVLHTVGPIVPRGQAPSLSEEAGLAAAYESCLEVASRVPAIRSVAFCAISTGIFGFPLSRATTIALETVDAWLRRRPGVTLQVVFNVFSRRDEEVYRTALAQYAPSTRRS